MSCQLGRRCHCVREFRHPPILVAQKDLLDRQAENIGYAERERQRRIVLARLDRVYALQRDLQSLGEVLLAPVAFGA